VSRTNRNIHVGKTEMRSNAEFGTMGIVDREYDEE